MQQEPQGDAFKKKSGLCEMGKTKLQTFKPLFFTYNYMIRVYIV